MDNGDAYKFVVIVNKKIESGKALNAVAHACLGLVNSASEEEKKKMSFIDYQGKDKNHKSISALSLIVLRGSNGEIKKARNKFIEQNVHFTDFTITMTRWREARLRQVSSILSSFSKDMPSASIRRTSRSSTVSSSTSCTTSRGA